MADQLLDYQQAQKIILESLPAMTGEAVTLTEARGRFLFDDFHAGSDLPRYDNSAMDGYAVRSADTGPAVQLEVVGMVAAGADRSAEVQPGTAVQIMTGAALPVGADAVVPVEEVKLLGNTLQLNGSVEPWQHVRRCGEDLARGELAIPSGRRLAPAELGLIASFGTETIKVSRQPTVAVLATGDEIVPPGHTLGSSQTYDCNTTALCSAIAAAGGRPVPLGIARDDHQSLADKIEQGLESDVLLTAAGASVGEFDLVRDVLRRSGAEEAFWGVAIKPGKPTAYCRCQGRPVFCLPGNPISALVTFEIFVRPALLKMTGCRDALPEKFWLPLAEPLEKKRSRTLFARVKLVNRPEGLAVASSGRQQTGMLTTLSRADGLAILPDGRTRFEAGEMVEVMILRY